MSIYQDITLPNIYPIQFYNKVSRLESRLYSSTICINRLNIGWVTSLYHKSKASILSDDSQGSESINEYNIYEQSMTLVTLSRLSSMDNLSKSNRNNKQGWVMFKILHSRVVNKLLPPWQSETWKSSYLMSIVQV